MSSSKQPNGAVCDEMAGETVNSLGSTVGTFATRLQRRLKEQEIAQDVSQRAAEERHARMLQAMTTIRKALGETCKINLGSRFQFQLKVTDWEGWPRVELALFDRIIPDHAEHGLVVTTHDRDGTGAVCFATRGEFPLGKVLLAQPDELERLPKVLKKCVRDFLDLISHYVLNPIVPGEDNARIDISEKPDFDAVSHKLMDEDVFTEQDYGHDDNQVEISDAEAEPVAISLEK